MASVALHLYLMLSISNVITSYSPESKFCSVSRQNYIVLLYLEVFSINLHTVYYFNTDYLAFMDGPLRFYLVTTIIVVYLTRLSLNLINYY